MRISQRDMRGLPAEVLSTGSRNLILLMPFNNLLCFFAISSLPQVMDILAQYSRCCWKAMCFSSHIPHSWGNQTLTNCSPFSPLERLPPSDTSAHAISLNSCYNLTLGRMDSKANISHLWTSVQVSILKDFSKHAKMVGADSLARLVS